MRQLAFINFSQNADQISDRKLAELFKSRCEESKRVYWIRFKKTALSSSLKLLVPLGVHDDGGLRTWVTWRSHKLEVQQNLSISVIHEKTCDLPIQHSEIVVLTKRWKRRLLSELITKNSQITITIHKPYNFSSTIGLLIYAKQQSAPSVCACVHIRQIAIISSLPVPHINRGGNCFFKCGRVNEDRASIIFGKGTNPDRE